MEVDMNWVSNLTETERKVILASTSHVIEGFDFILSESEFTLADQVFLDLDEVQNGKAPQGYAMKIPDGLHKAIWAASCAFAQDVHAPIDNLSEDDWQQLERFHVGLNMWGIDDEVAGPHSPTI